jgi:regulator of protease activity HflC (stomatin/prohibitin superfamily)
MIQEIESKPASGYPMLAMGLLLWFPIAPLCFLLGVLFQFPIVGVPLGIFSILSGLLILVGLFIVNPNESKVLLLFGVYTGTVRQTGFFWANPFYSKKRVSMRTRIFETGFNTTTNTATNAQGGTQTTSSKVRQPAKVNDKEGNPIEIAAVVTWQVINTVEALFQVDNYEEYVHIQSESALRNLASLYPYDNHDDNTMSLRGNTAEVGEMLKRELHERLSSAGVEVMEARISSLAYAPEIASSMLQRQQASAILAARRIIVEGAVGMVEDALARIEKGGMVNFDDDRKAAMISNLLVVLCGERSAQPVLNTGSIHH